MEYIRDLDCDRDGAGCLFWHFDFEVHSCRVDRSERESRCLVVVVALDVLPK